MRAGPHATLPRSASSAPWVAHGDVLPSADRAAQRPRALKGAPRQTPGGEFQLQRPLSFCLATLPAPRAGAPGLSLEPRPARDGPAGRTPPPLHRPTCEGSSWELPRVAVLGLALAFQPRDHVRLREREFCSRDVTHVAAALPSGARAKSVLGGTYPLPGPRHRET